MSSFKEKIMKVLAREISKHCLNPWNATKFAVERLKWIRNLKNSTLKAMRLVWGLNQLGRELGSTCRARTLRIDAGSRDRGYPLLIKHPLNWL